MAKILQLNIKDFEDEVNNYLSSHNGQKYVRDIIASGGNTTGGVSIDDAIRAAEELKRLIQTFASMEFSISQYSIYNNVHNIDIGIPIDNGDGTYTRDDDKWLQYLSNPVQVNLEDVKLYETALERAPGRQEYLESLVAEEIYALTFILGG